MARDTQGSPADEKKLEQYGVWVKVKPRDVTTAPVLEESFGLSDLESPRAPARAGKAGGQSALTAEEEKLLDELETELDPGEEAAGIAVPDEEPLLDDAELPEIETATGRRGSSDLEPGSSDDDELPELEEDLEPAPRAAPKAGGHAAGRGRASEVEVTLSENAEDDHFDDLAALETELASVSTRTSEASSSSAEILARIEDELRSIRSDLNQLRHDLSGLRKTAAEGGGEGPSAQAGSQGGFFDEEDEAIALTGDELDNILNTAEITEESAEPQGAGADMDLMAGTDAVESTGTEDVLSFETPAPEPVEMPAASDDLDMLEDAEPADDTLVLTDDDLLPTAGAHGDSGAADAEELPADLVLEELTDESAPAADAASSDMPEIDLEEIPEMETEPEIAPAPRVDSAMDDEGSETIDLETLDLGEEPTVINAVPEQVEDVEDLQDAEEVMELDEAPAPKASGRAAAQQPDEVDLEALAAEAEELEDDVPAAPVVEDLEIGELETLSDEAGGIVTPQKEIEIDFEADLAEDVEALPSATDDVMEAEEAPVQKAPARAANADAAGGVPDNLKDEIRTVLKYMDHLLEALPDEKIQEFASSDYFVMYKKLFEDLGLGE